MGHVAVVLAKLLDDMTIAGGARCSGVLVMLDGIGVLIWFLQALLLPDYPAIRYPGLAVSFVAELGLALRLLVKGVKVGGSGAGLPGSSGVVRP